MTPFGESPFWSFDRFGINHHHLVYTKGHGILSMALVTVSGYPCSGKSRRVQQLKEYLESRLVEPESSNIPNLKVVVISDDSLNIKRNVYNGL